MKIAIRRPSAAVEQVAHQRPHALGDVALEPDAPIGLLEQGLHETQFREGVEAPGDERRPVNWSTRQRSSTVSPADMSLIQLCGRLGPTSVRSPGRKGPMWSPT